MSEQNWGCLDKMSEVNFSPTETLRVHLSTEEPAASRMLEPFGEVGGDVPEYFLSRTHFAKIVDKKSYCEKLSLKT